MTSVIEGLKPFSPCVCYYTRTDILDFALLPENVLPEHSPNFVISRVRMGAESEKNERRVESIFGILAPRGAIFDTLSISVLP